MKSNLLKSIFISLILVMGVNNAWGATQTYVAGEYIYIKNFVPTGWGTTTWILSNSYAWAHMWGGTAGEHDYLFELYSGTAGSSGAIYRAKVTTGGTYTNVIFTRNSSNKGPWNDKWNQTGDIVLDGSSNCFTAFTADKTSKTCSKYAAAPTAATLTLDGAISGDGSQANPYNVYEGVNYTLTASGTFPDPGNTKQYAFNNTTYGTTNTKTVSFTSGTTSYYANVRAKEDSEYSTPKKVTIYLNVVQPTYSYTVTAGEGGKVTPTSGTVAQGSGVTITATPDDGYEFNKWTATNGTLANANSASTTFTPSANNAKATASFKLAGCTQTPTTPTSLTAKVGGNALAGEVCSETSVTLTAGGSISVGSLQWGIGTVGENIIAEGNGRSSITVSPAATTTYWVRSIINEAGVCYGVTSDAKTLQVSITPALVQPVLSKSTLTLEEGGSTGSITVTSGTTGGTWTSSDQNVATVDNGTVTSVGPGTATITYTVSNGCEEDKTATCDVTVNAKPYYIAGRLQQNWNTSSTTQQFTYVSNGQYKYETGKTVAELSAQWQDNGYKADQYFFIHAGGGLSKSFASSSSNGHKFHQKLDYANALTLSANTTDDEKKFIKFTDATDKSSDVVIWWEPSTNKLWYTATANYTVTYSRVPTAAADAPTTSPSVSSGNSVVAGTSVTFTAKDAKPGYAWKGWYDNNAGTGTALSTNKAYTHTINADTEIYAVYTEILSTITITTNPEEGGNVTVDDKPFTPGNTVQVGVTTTCTVTTTANEGYGVISWGVSNKDIVIINGGHTITLNSDGSGRDGTLTANYIPLSRNILFDKQSGEDGTETAIVTYTQNNYDPASVAAPSRAGYTFGGYYSEEKGAGVQVVSAEGQWLANATDYTNADGNWLKSAENTTLYAHWIGAPYTVELNQDGAAKKGSTTSVVANFEGNMPAITGDGALPTPPNGYAFMGYFDQKDGKGTQYYDSIGTSAHPWDKTEKDTLYAYFKAAEIIIGLNAASFEPNSATPVIATATLKPTPVGTTSICWELLYNDDTPVAEHDPQPTGEPNQVQFNINDLATGTYQIKATLREGAGCTGTIISHATQVFTITSDHTITIRYVDENGQTIKASETQFAHVSSLTEITAPEIIGYTFKEWEAGDGVSIKGATDGKKNTDTIEYNAYYDGYLKAIYTKNSNIIYFYNTLGWENVYVYFYNEANGYKYWTDDYGTGAHQNKDFGAWDRKPFWEMEHGQMEQIEGTNIWYFQMENKRSKVAFATVNQTYKEGDNVSNTTAFFQDAEVVYRDDLDSEGRLPMFVPNPTISHDMTNTKSKYYNHGYWMNYPNHSGYTLDLFNHQSNNDPARYFIYPYSQDTIFPLQIQVDINAENIADDGKKKIWFRIHRNDGKNFGGNANTFPSVKPGTTGGFITENDYKVELITPIAGTYTFILDYKYDETAKDYKYHISVDYPAAVGDYRILYRDAAEKTWSGKDKNKEGDEIKWYHASRVIKKGTDTKDIISFFINKDIKRTLSYQTIEAIDKDGNITWSKTEVEFSHVDWSQIDTSGVYNFVFVQDGNGISLDNTIEPYTGNYYIRCDAMDGNWEDYKTNPDNRMFYSAFSESDANSFGEQFSHYAVKWCEAGTNVKFTIANDYSHCISDTLAQDIIPLGNLTDEGTLLNNDIYDANIRFMWNRKTNKISRAYVGPAGDKQSQFLMLQSCSEFKDAAGNDLNPAEGDILDKEKNIYAARFTDTQNWIYERTIQVKPRTRVKLYASYPNGYHIYIENNTGWKDVALYAFKDVGGEPLGTWPGVQPTRTVKIGDKTYYDFPINKYVFGSTLIFNNNVKEDGQQTSDYTDFATVGEYYLTASSNKELTKNKYVQTTVEATEQYFRGEYAEGSCDDEHTIQILGGEGETWNTIRVIYDFKTNRLMAAWMPNNNEIDTVRIESDVMIIRDHQNAAQCITFANDSSKLTAVKTVYGVMRFNRWILNNRGGADNLDIESCTKVVDNQTVYDHDITNQYHPILEPAKQTSQYERALYFISFPFDVHLSDVFGFGTYGQHWIIEYYDGLKRAKEGYWIDSDPNWKYVTDPANFVLEKYKGYILCLNLGKMAYDNTDFWAHNISQVELFFPSTTTMEEIAKAEVTMPKLGEEYLCKINRGDGTEGDRRVKDSYWRCIGVPSYANYSNVLKDEEGKTIKWQTSYKTFPFLYKWNKTDNTLTPKSTTNFEFETMHAYLVQNGGEIHWSAVNATPDKPNAGIIAKVKETTRNYEWRITLTQGEKEQDQAFVRLSDDEQVTTEFDFNQDLSKEFNYGRSDIYTLIGYEKAAANSLPLSEQTTLIPLGLSIEYNGDYTIAMPDGTANIGVTLIDTESNTRTNLSAGMEYTLTLKKGDYNNRFFIEISPIQQTPTDIEYVENSHDDQARKVLIDNILYIVRDGQIFDARGARVK